MSKTNFFKDFGLEKPTAGLVMKVTSPKGIRTQTDDGYSYDLYEDLITADAETYFDAEPGLYHLIDICHPQERTIWNHYMLQVTKDNAYLVAEFLDQTDSSWVREAIPVLKKVFSGETLEPIVPTKFLKTTEQTNGWKNCKK